MKIDVIKGGTLPRRRPRLAAFVVLAIALLALLSALAAVAWSLIGDERPYAEVANENLVRKPRTHSEVVRALSKWTTTDPGNLRPVSSEDARRLNEDVPVSQENNSPATPLALPASNMQNLTAGLDCMTAAIYHEAASEPLDGQRAVAQVILNRVRHPAYPKTVCGVVYQGVEKGVSCQFTFACDGSLARKPVPALWRQARLVAMAALSGLVYGKVGWATHYHADYVFPYWAPTLVKALVLGRHIFYRMPGGMGTQSAFRGPYVANEWHEMQQAQAHERVLLADMPGKDGLDAQLPVAAVAVTERGVLLPSGGYANAPGNGVVADSAPAPAASRAPERYILGADGDKLN